MRVVSGRARGVRLDAPDEPGVRPTTSLAREAIFEMLKHRLELSQSRVLDLFAGSGALGIEALSRGAASVTFVERDRGALAVIRSNLRRLPAGLAAGAEVVAMEALAFARRYGSSYDLVLADPPYGYGEWAALLAACSSALVVAEAERALTAAPSQELLRERRYGTTRVHLFAPMAGGEEGW